MAAKTMSPTQSQSQLQLQSTLALTRNNWIMTQHYGDIEHWDQETCLAFLNLSETSQHKLPGTEGIKTAKVRRQVVDRLRFLISTIATPPSQSQAPPPPPPLLMTTKEHEHVLKTVISNLSSLLPPSEQSTK